MSKNNIVNTILRINSKDAEKNADKAKKAVVDYGKELRKITNITKNAFNATPIVGLVKGVISLTNAMINASKKQTDYIENLNLMDTAYGKVNNSGRKLIDTMSETIGLDQSGLTKTLGTYRQISSALGLASDSADKFSENMLKMTQDVSSLYNMTFEQSAQKMISAITGQSRAVKVLGADITDAGLQQTVYNLGIEKSVSNMTQAEKTIIRYITLNHQLANAQGDTAKTINEVSNQTKIFKEQLAIAARQIGAIFIPILKAILPVINGVLMAFNTLVGTILGFFGIDAKSIANNFGKSANSISLGFDDIGTSAANAGKAAKEALKELRGFDKLNTIKTPTQTAGGSSGISGGVGGGIDSSFLKALDDANWTLGDINQKAIKIRDNILEWLGFTKDANGEWKFSHVTFGTILTTIMAIVAAYSGLTKIAGIFSKIGSLLGISGKGGILGTITSIGTAVLGVFGIEGAGALAGFAAGLGTIAAVAGAIYGVFKLIEALDVKVVKETTDWWVNASEDTSKRIGTVHDSLLELQSEIDRFSYMGMEMSQSDYDAILGKIVSLKDAALSELDDWYIQELSKLDELYPTEEDKQSESYKLQKEALQEHYNDGKNQLDSYINEYKAKFKQFYADDKKITNDERLELLEIQKKIDQWSIDNLVANTDDKLSIQTEYEKKAKAQSISEAVQELERAKKQKDDIIKEANETFNKRSALLDKESAHYGEQLIALQNERKAAIDAATLDYDKFYSGWKNSNSYIADFVDKSTGTITNKIGKSFQDTEQKSLILDKFLQGKMTYWEAANQGLADDIFGLDTKFTDTLGSITNQCYNDGRQAAQKYADGWNSRSMTLKTPTASGGNQSYNLNIKYKYNGGFLNSGDLFWANENGHPEMVGSINGKTAVANNDQIVESISIGVARAMAGANRKTDVTIVAEGDTRGLLDFINFKQKEKDRQYGL